MSSKTFKLSTLAALVLAATHANAALYRVVEVTQPSGTEAYGSAIEEGTTSCFTTDCSDGSGYTLAGDTLEGTMGFSYKQEVPFGFDNFFTILDQDDLETYCSNELGYNTCESWASYQWNGIDDAGGLKREREAWSLVSYTSNATAFTNASGSSISVDSPDPTEDPQGTTSSPESASKNVVINALGGTTPIGNTSSGYFDLSGNYALTYRNRGFYGSTLLLPEQGDENIVEKMGRTMAFDSFTYGGSTYVVGSAAVAPFDASDSSKDYLGDVSSCSTYDYPATYAECQNFAFAQKAYVWNVTNTSSTNGVTTATGIAATDWNSGSSANVEEESAEAGIRGVVIPASGTYSGKPVMVGFNTAVYDSNLMMQAAVYYPNDTFDASGVVADAWDSTFISGAELRQSSNYVYSNSVAKDINDNLLVIGEAKRETSENGAFNNRLFIADASDGAPSASYLSGGIFFSGAGGEANAINNYNEIVGQIDAETHRENNGKKRRRRGFIYPYNGTNSDSTRMALFSNQAWWLDDLTNGGTYSDNNNQYRIFNAADINDAGVIAASAFKCDGGYSSTAHFATCDGDEQIVAVKLIPLSSEQSIVERAESDSSSSERSGAGLGWLSIMLLGLMGIRRKFA
ncbi:GlyGly-CTERM sorting domain-containing protein [Vibrio albus]|jgi:hypothetical protein|uniref:GlyGly-CTERM sorting domain-containing protein n=1 Tax=Vibrio albus TaxID=2200953 RepID=A0A2U3BBJ9_9VIBR|nr:DUF3466 family protein [Vibrio albus]PWI34166.1 GlyGly-CTERM sorting domain-containing protein [Vibrio albus]